MAQGSCSPTKNEMLIGKVRALSLRPKGIPMPKIDAAFLRNVQEHCNGGSEWCKERDIKWLDLAKYAATTASAAAESDAGLASYGVAMFKLGYEVRRAQELGNAQATGDWKAYTLKETAVEKQAREAEERGQR